MKILISAGHTNNPALDQGAAGNGFIEGEETLKVRDVVVSSLRSRGLTVIKDGLDGVNDPLTKAIALAKTSDVAIEFHFNAGPSGATGAEVLSKSNHRAFGRSLAQAVASVLQIPLRGNDSGWKSDSSGQHHRLGFCEAGGLIVEIAFISNAGDMESYENNFPTLCDRIADTIATFAVPKNETDAETQTHLVVSGDTLFGIGGKYRVSVPELKRLNGLESNGIQVGQTLKIR